MTTTSGGNLETTKSDSITPAKMYEVLQVGIKETDQISFKLLGLVPLVNGAALLTAVLGIGSSRAPAILVLSLFGAVVTLGLFWWELRNIRYCLWYIKLTEFFEAAVLGQIGVPEELRRRPTAPGGVGKRKAEKLIYSTVIFSWLTLPVMLLDRSAPPWIAPPWTVWLVYAVLAAVVIAWTVRAIRTEVELPVRTRA
jgi:hypothetical protein